MTNEQRKKYLEMLSANKMYADALSSVTDESERKKIEAFAEDVLLNLVAGMTTLQKIATEHPEKLAEVAKNHIPKE